MGNFQPTSSAVNSSTSAPPPRRSAGGRQSATATDTAGSPVLLLRSPISVLAQPTAETTPPPPSWSDIPLELAGLVLGRLPAHADRVRFAAVCPQWRRAAREVPVPPPLPLLALPYGTVYSLPGSEPFRIPGCSGYGDASGSWLAFSDDDGCFLRNPFTNATVTLPLRFRVRSHRGRAGEEETEVEWMEIEDAAEQLTMYKVVFCSPQLIAASVCRPGADSWWSVHTEEFLLLADMTFHQENLYVTDYFEALFMIDISLDGTTGENVIVKMLYLIELRGELLMPDGAQKDPQPEDDTHRCSGSVSVVWCSQKQ